MRKESIIVGVFGLSLGLLVAWGIWTFKSTAPQPQELSLSPSTTPTTNLSPTATPIPSFSLNLESPQNETLATEGSILVKGKTKPASTVVILTNLEDYVLTAGQDGSFSQEVELEEGENVLTATSYSPDKKEETVERTVIYTKETT